MNGQLSTDRRVSRAERMAGVAVSAGLHLVLASAVFLAHRYGTRTQPVFRKTEPIKAQLIEIKAGSPDGRIKDPSKVQAGQPWGRRKQGPVRHPYGPDPAKIRPDQSPAPQTQGPGYTTDRFGRLHTKKPNQPSIDDDTNKEQKAMARQATLDGLAGKELDPDDVKYGRYGTAQKGRTDANARGSYGNSAKGTDDPCITRFKKARAAYQAYIYGKVSGFRRPSFVSPQLAENLVTRVRVTFDTGGKITKVATVSSSGNARFDETAESFIRNLGAFAQPPRCVMFDMKTGRFLKTRSFLVNMKGR